MRRRHHVTARLEENERGTEVRRKCGRGRKARRRVIPWALPSSFTIGANAHYIRGNLLDVFTYILNFGVRLPPTPMRPHIITFPSSADNPLGVRKRNKCLNEGIRMRARRARDRLDAPQSIVSLHSFGLGYAFNREYVELR